MRVRRQNTLSLRECHFSDNLITLACPYPPHTCVCDLVAEIQCELLQAGHGAQA